MRCTNYVSNSARAQRVDPLIAREPVVRALPEGLASRDLRGVKTERGRRRGLCQQRDLIAPAGHLRRHAARALQQILELRREDVDLRRDQRELELVRSILADAFDERDDLSAELRSLGEQDLSPVWWVRPDPGT